MLTKGEVLAAGANAGIHGANAEASGSNVEIVVGLMLSLMEKHSVLREML